MMLIAYVSIGLTAKKLWVTQIANVRCTCLLKLGLRSVAVTDVLNPWKRPWQQHVYLIYEPLELSNNIQHT